MGRVGGRPRRIDVDDIVRAGREIGMRDLSMNAVAARLGVSATALYRHVDDRWALERLVGESILTELDLIDDPSDTAVSHLVSLGLQMRAFMLQHPGLTAYVQTLFPRGEAGRRLIMQEVEALGERGYSVDAAILLASAVTSTAIGYAAGEDVQRGRVDGLAGQQRAVEEAIVGDEILGAAHRSFPELDMDDYVRLWLGASVRAFVDAAPPGRPVAEILAALDAAGKGL